MPEAFLQYVAGCLVEKPEKVSIQEIPTSEETIVELRVDDEDIGRVIGKNGSVARALRTMVSAIGARKGKDYQLEVID
ncbi:MAG: KH domain-containing protein [Leptospiraceae bacterium]|nr:KH domain-containing protein [Leptospiraceae bacterium]